MFTVLWYLNSYTVLLYFKSIKFSLCSYLGVKASLIFVFPQVSYNSTLILQKYQIFTVLWYLKKCKLIQCNMINVHCASYTVLWYFKSIKFSLCSYLGVKASLIFVFPQVSYNSTLILQKYQIFTVLWYLRKCKLIQFNMIIVCCSCSTRRCTTICRCDTNFIAFFYKVYPRVMEVPHINILCIRTNASSVSDCHHQD